MVIVILHFVCCVVLYCIAVISIQKKYDFSLFLKITRNIDQTLQNKVPYMELVPVVKSTPATTCSALLHTTIYTGSSTYL